jgi:hypothetical protein
MGLEEASSGKRLHAWKLEKGDHIVNLRDGLPAKTFEKICRTIDEAIEDVVAAKSAKLVWLNTGSLVGDRASLPHASHQHLWDAAYRLFPSNTDPVAVKHQRITVGALIKWRVARRPEDWLVHYRETDKIDIVTGELIKASEYWIKPAGVVLTRPVPKSARQAGTTIEDIMKKWNTDR